MQEYLAELKIAHLSRTHYRETDNAGADERKQGIRRRAAQIPREYVAKAQQADQKYCGTPAGQVGPIEQRLRAFQRVMPLAFGAFGETSDDVERLMETLAQSGAERHWRRMKAKKEEHAHGALMWLLRRRWGMTALRENARLILERLPYIGAGARSKFDRSARALAQAGKRAKARADALELSSFGPSVGDSRPIAATRWA